MANCPERIPSSTAQPLMPVRGAQSKMYNGVQYDYVFDVELDAGIKRKLPYNRDQNPYEVAQRWLEENGLPLDQTEQVRRRGAPSPGCRPFASMHRPRRHLLGCTPGRVRRSGTFRTAGPPLLFVAGGRRLLGSSRLLSRSSGRASLAGQ